MKRVMVIGNCGVGKSTFSKKLGSIENLEVIHLDMHYWKPDWTESSPGEWKDKVHELAGKTSWIIDGNYGGTMDIRIEKADTIIFFNYPTRMALWRVFKRTFKYWKKSRPDMPLDCKERFSLKFIIYVTLFNFRRKKNILKKLTLAINIKDVFVFKNDIESTRFLKRLNSESHEIINN